MPHISNRAVRFTASETEPIVLRNVGGDSVYYSDDPNVSSSSNQGTLTSGSTIQITKSTYVISAGDSEVVSQAPAPGATGPGRVESADTYSAVDTYTVAPSFQAGFTPPAAVALPYTGGVAQVAATPGTNVTPVSGTIYYAQVQLPANATITGIAYLIGTVGGTNSAIVALYNAAGAKVANSALAGTLVGTTETWQRLDFTAPYAAVGPARYWVSVSMNGTTARLRTHSVGDHPTGSQTGVFGTLDAIASPPTTFTASVGPYARPY